MKGKYDDLLTAASFRINDKISSIIPNTQDLVLSGYEVPAGTHLDLNPSVHFR